MKNYKLIIGFIALASSPLCSAQWQHFSVQKSFIDSDLSQQETITAYKSTHSDQIQILSYIQNDHQEVTDIFNRDQSHEGLQFISNNKLSSSGKLFFSTTVSRNEQRLSSVLSSGQWRFGLSAGQGENFVKANQTFTGIDPYFMHGGSAVKFNYYDANTGYESKNESTFYFGSATVQAERLEDRQASYLGYQGKNLSASVMNFKRGSESIGKGIEVDTKLGKLDFGYRQISRNNGAHSKTLSVNVSSSLVKAGKFGFAIESVNNPLYREQDDLNFMFSFSGQWRKPKSTFNLETEEEPQSPGINKMAVIGAGVVAGALIASSGSSSKDNQEIIVVQGQDDAGFEVLNRINPESVRLNREHGGFIYRNRNGTYGYTEPKLGQVASVNLGGVAIPNGTRHAATYHTHAGPDPRFDNENFSPQDIRSDTVLGIDGYLGTPGGLMKHHDIESARIRTVRRIAN